MKDHIKSIVEQLTVKPESIDIDDDKAELLFKNSKGDWLRIFVDDTSSYKVVYKFESVDGWCKDIGYLNLLDLQDEVTKFMR